MSTPGRSAAVSSTGDDGGAGDRGAANGGGARLRGRVLWWVAVGAVGAAGVGVALGEDGLDGAPEVLAVVGVASVVQLVVVALLVFGLDLFRARPLALKLLAFAWGGTVAIWVAQYANTALLSALTKLGLESIGATIAAPLNEETTKLLGVLVVLTLLAPQRVSALRGVVIGFLVGAGFDVVENAGYAFQAAAEVGAGARTGELVDAAIASFGDRLTQGFALHALWTAIAGAGLAFALRGRTADARSAPGREHPPQPAPAPARARPRWRWAVAIGAIALALVLHGLWDLPEVTASGATQNTLMGIEYGATIVIFVAIWAVSARADRRSERPDTRRADRRADRRAGPPPAIRPQASPPAA